MFNLLLSLILVRTRVLELYCYVQGTHQILSWKYNRGINSYFTKNGRSWNQCSCWGDCLSMTPGCLPSKLKVGTSKRADLGSCYLKFGGKLLGIMDKQFSPKRSMPTFPNLRYVLLWRIQSVLNHSWLFRWSYDQSKCDLAAQSGCLAIDLAGKTWAKIRSDTEYCPHWTPRPSWLMMRW